MLTSGVVIVSRGPVFGNKKEFRTVQKVLGSVVIVFRVGWSCVCRGWKRNILCLRGHEEHVFHVVVVGSDQYLLV